MPKCKNLKNVILVCSFYNGGYSLIRGSEAWHCRILAKKFNMPYDFGLNPKYDFAFYDKIIEQMTPRFDRVYCQGYDFAGIEIHPSTKKTRERALHHFKIYQKYKNQLPVLDEICAFCQKADLRLILVDAPVRSDYAAVLAEAAPDTDLTALIKEVAGRYQIKLIKPAGFADEDFADSDHLNFNGALKLTRQLVKVLENGK
ncbi:MAG: hypothetical protein IJ752_09635 [Alphaproteobacteria bacterium]|nr:hypothetical protein [Alphaproteobacteria bacterium]